MASLLKLSLAIGLFGLVALAAVLSWYFAFAGSASSAFSLEGIDPVTGATIRLVANGDQIAFEIIDNPVSDTWTLYKSLVSNTEFGVAAIQNGGAAWECTKVPHAAAPDASSLGASLFSDVGADGGATSIKIGAGSIPVVFNSNGITNFGGYEVSAFSFGAASLNSFKTGLPALPDLATCHEPAAAQAEAVVEGNYAPICSSFPSLMAFLQKRSYATSAAASFCSGSSTAVTCTATTQKYIKGLISGRSYGTDRAFKCTNSVYGTILTFSGSDDISDWVANIGGALVKVPWNYTLVHSGFLAKFLVWDSWVDANASPTGKNLFNGHSLGGAIANVGAVYWKAKKPSATVAVVTCGAPAAFYAGLHLYSIKNSRYENFRRTPWYSPNQRDVVTVVTGLLGWHHAIGSVQYGQIQDDTSSTWTQGTLDVLPILGDVFAVMDMHTTYPTSTDAARRYQSFV